jgi:hypothetical protein
MFLVAQTRGAEPSASPQQTENPSPTITSAQDDVAEPTLPKCHVNFEVSQEVLSKSIAGVDEELWEQKFVAEFRIRLPLLNLELKKSQAVPEWVEENERAQLVLKMFQENFRKGTQHKDFLAFLQEIPEERRPRSEVFDPRVRVTVSSTIAGGYQDLSWHVFAITPDGAKEVVESLLSISDYGLSLPMQKQFVRRKVLAAKELAQVRKELEQVKVNIDEWKSQLETMKDYEDVGSEALTTYLAQRRTINVESSGITARIDACNKLLGQAKANLPASRVEQIETIKIAAEIELVGLTAKKSAISTIVQNGQNRVALLDKVKITLRKQSELQEAISSLEKNITLCIGGRKAWEACPLERETVTIRPIKWVASGKKSTREEK